MIGLFPAVLLLIYDNDCKQQSDGILPDIDGGVGFGGCLFSSLKKPQRTHTQRFMCRFTNNFLSVKNSEPDPRKYLCDFIGTAFE
jgi:hypothetical protein